MILEKAMHYWVFNTSHKTDMSKMSQFSPQKSEQIIL